MGGVACGGEEVQLQFVMIQILVRPGNGVKGIRHRALAAS